MTDPDPVTDPDPATDTGADPVVSEVYPAATPRTPIRE